MLAVSVLSPGAQAASTAAGTPVANTAAARYTDTLGNPVSVSSNAVTNAIDQLLNVVVASADAGKVTASSPQTAVPLTFRVTNTGNGAEGYALSFSNTVAGSQFNPTNTHIYLDTPGTGVFNPAGDALYVPGSNDPLIAAGATVTVFVVSDIPPGLADGSTGLVSLTAEALLQQAAPAIEPTGYVFAGQGTGGVDAIVGATRAVGTAQGGYIVSQALPTLTKSQSVADPSGGSNAVQGATVTYTLVFATTGTGSLAGSEVDDPVPAGTTYVPGSLTLDGAPLTDASDTDTGSFTGGAIRVILGTVVAPSTHTITFKVKIN